MLYLYLLVILSLLPFSLSRPNFFLNHVENFSRQQKFLTLSLFLILLIIYGILLFKQKIKIKISVPIIVLVFLGLTLMPPFLSRDVVSYFLTGRNLGHYGLNPYKTPIGQAINPWTKEMDQTWWLEYPSPYGPFFLIIPFLITLLKIENIITNILIYKFIVLAAFGLILYFFQKLDSPNDKKTFFLFALNPAVLVHLLGEGHNEVFILFWLFLSLFLINKRPVLGITTFIISVFTKYTTLIFWPVFWSKKNLIISGLFLVISGILFFKISGLAPSEFFASFSFLSQGCLYACPPPFQLLKPLTGPVPFLLLYGLFFYFHLYKNRDIFKFIFWSFFALIFLGTSWLAPWYPVLIIPFGLLIKEKKYLYLTYFLTAYSLLHYFGM